MRGKPQRGASCDPNGVAPSEALHPIDGTLFVNDATPLGLASR